MEEDMEATVKLAIHVAETGHYFELNCPDSTPVHVLQSCIGSAVHVDPQDQLLLCGHLRLESQKTLASYRFPSENWNVFLFNRARLLPDSCPPSIQCNPVKQLALPPSPAMPLRLHPLSDSLNAAADDLPSYETCFTYHFQKGSAYFVCSRDKFEWCSRLLRDQQVQGLAMDAAKNNMNHLLETIEQSSADFNKRFNAKHKNHAAMIVNLDQDLERLRACKLHPSLASEKRLSLLDCLDEASLRKQAAVCATSHRQLQAQVMQSIASYTELHHSIQDVLNVPLSVDLHRLEQLVSENARMLEEQHVILQSLRKDVGTVKKLVSSPGSLRLHDAITALGPMYDVHERNQLPKMEACHKKLENLLKFFVTKKHEMSVGLHAFMQKVAALQSKARDMRNQFSTIDEAIKLQENLFSDLKLVCKVGPSYRACLAEVLRRTASMKLYMGQAGQLAEMMAKKRADEAARRDKFLQSNSAILPHDLLVSMGLFSNPSQCVVNVEPYDTSLLHFHVEDLEKYAPETLCGPYFKAAGTSNIHFLGDVHVLSRSKECLQENPSIETLDEMSTEIAGTSKLEVENAWLKAEYASAIAVLCSIDTNFESMASGDENDPRKDNEALDVVKRTMEALTLKDEHAKHLRSLLSASQSRCDVYEKRIQELEQRLCDRYNELHGQESNGCTAGSDDAEVSEITGEGRNSSTGPPFELIEECSSDKKPVTAVQHNRVEQRLEGNGKAMVETGLITFRAQQEDVESAHNLLATSLENELISCPADYIGIKPDNLTCMEEAVLPTANCCVAKEEILESALKELGILKEELQKKTVLLNECYMNCAGLESNLQSAREEAWTNQCLASRKAAEYAALRSSTVRLRGLIERLRQCVSSTPTDLLHSLQLLAKSLDRDDNKDDATEEFSRCLRILVEKAGQLLQKDCRSVQSSGCLMNNLASGELRTKMASLKEQYASQSLHKQL